MTAQVRLVAKVIARPSSSQVRHYRGLPPELGGADDTREEMPLAEVLLIEVETDGVFLFRLTADGLFAGDTWHQSIQEAQEQAKFEFGPDLSNWTPVPSDVEDMIAYARKL